MKVSWENIYQDYANTGFRKSGIRPPYHFREISRYDKSKYCHFHKTRGHNTYNFIQLNDALEILIKRCRVADYIKREKETGNILLRENLVQRLQISEPREGVPSKTIYILSHSKTTYWFFSLNKMLSLFYSIFLF